MVKLAQGVPGSVMSVYYQLKKCKAFQSLDYSLVPLHSKFHLGLTVCRVRTRMMALSNGRKAPFDVSVLGILAGTLMIWAILVVLVTRFH